MYETSTPQKQRCFLVIRVYPKGQREIASDHETMCDARKDAMARAAISNDGVFVVYCPEEAYAVSPRVAERIRLDWPEPDAELAPAPLPVAEQVVAP